MCACVSCPIWLHNHLPGSSDAIYKIDVLACLGEHMSELFEPCSQCSSCPRYLALSHVREHTIKNVRKTYVREAENLIKFWDSLRYIYIGVIFTQVPKSLPEFGNLGQNIIVHPGTLNYFKLRSFDPSLPTQENIRKCIQI